MEGDLTPATLNAYRVSSPRPGEKLYVPEVVIYPRLALSISVFCKYIAETCEMRGLLKWCSVRAVSLFRIWDIIPRARQNACQTPAALCSRWRRAGETAAPPRPCGFRVSCLTALLTGARAVFGRIARPQIGRGEAGQDVRPNLGLHDGNPDPRSRAA